MKYDSRDDFTGSNSGNAMRREALAGSTSESSAGRGCQRRGRDGRSDHRGMASAVVRIVADQTKAELHRRIEHAAVSVNDGFAFAEGVPQQSNAGRNIVLRRIVEALAGS